MKKRRLFFFIVIAASSLTFSACSNTENKAASEPGQNSKERYQCPMKCTNEIFDRAGKCPVCEMDLEKVINS